MKAIEEISFKVNEFKCTYKVNKFEEVTNKKIKKPNGEEVDTKVKTTKYAIIQEFENNGMCNSRLICETEMYATVLTVMKGVLTEYIKTIDKYQTPTI